MDGLLFRALAGAIARYLRRAETTRQPDAAQLRLAAAWRALLRLHSPTVHGHCPGCAHRRGEMCTVWRVAVAYFLRPPK